MKRFFVVLVLAFVATTACAQDTTLKEYTGRYVFPEGSFVASADVTVKDTTLTVSSPQGSSDLARRGRDTFSLVSYDGMVYFKRDAGGKVAGMRVEVGDMVADGTKEGSSALLPRRPALRPRQPVSAK